MDVAPMYASKSAVTSAQCKRSISKDEVSYVDRDEETMNLTEEKCKLLNKFSGQDDQEQNIEKVGKQNDVKESENQNEKDNHVKKSKNESVIPTETEKDKDIVQKFSPKAVENKPAATAYVSSPCQSNSVVDESYVRSNKKKPVLQEVETASPSKSRFPPYETHVKKETGVSPKSALVSASREGNLTETPVTSAKRKHFTNKDKVYNTIRYDESLVGTKVKVWWPEDNMYYKGVVTKFYPDKKKHKVLYVDGDEETLNLRTQRWKILKESSLRADEEQNTEVQGEEASPDIHKKKKPKTDPAASQEKIKYSANKFGGISFPGKSKGSTPKDNQSTQKTCGRSSDVVTTTSKEAAKSKEDEETLKISSKTNTVNKSNGKTPPSSCKLNSSGLTKAEKKEGKKLHLEDKRLRLEAEKLKIKADKEQSKIRLQDERLRLEAEKMKLLKKELDIRIMMIDASVMPEMQRLYFEELQKEIVMRRSYT